MDIDGSSDFEFIDEFFEEYGFGDFNYAEQHISVLYRILNYIKIKNIDININEDLADFKKMYFLNFNFYTMKNYKKLFPSIWVTNENDKKDLSELFHCLELIYSPNNDTFIVSWDDENYEKYGSVIILNNKKILELISKKLYIKTIFSNDIELIDKLIIDIAGICQNALDESNFKMRIENELIKKIYYAVLENETFIDDEYYKLTTGQ